MAPLAPVTKTRIGFSFLHIRAVARVYLYDPRRRWNVTDVGGEIGRQPTAFFTSALIFFSSVAVNFFSAKEVGHMAPSSRLAESLKPNVAYRDLNFSALRKKQRTLPSLVYAGI